MGGAAGAQALPRVVVVHDYLTQRGGAERVALALLRTFPGARCLTSAYDPAGTFPEFAEHDVQTLYLGRVPLLRRDPRLALPLLASAFSRHRVADADVVVASTSGWAHGVGGDLPTVVYCHNPARWLYQAEDYLAARSSGVRRAAVLATRRLRAWDSRSAHGTAMYFANSTSVRDRIGAVYGIDAEVLTPPSSLDADGPQRPVPGLEPGFLLTVARGRTYKNTAAVCAAVAHLPEERLVVVGGLPEGGPWPDRITGLSHLHDDEVRWLYAHCSAVVALSREDFGLTPVEGYSFGKPAVVLRAGGYLDSADPEHATVFVASAERAEVVRGLRELRARTWDPELVLKHADRFGLAPFQSRLRAAVRSVAADPRSPRLVGREDVVTPAGDHRRRRAGDAARRDGSPPVG